MSTIYWGIRIDLTDNNTDTDASIGLYSGYLNWITGRPGYAGSGYSGEATAGLTWKEGILLDNIAPMIRMAKNLEVSGGYGGLSSFQFSIDDTSGINNTLDSNSYWVENRPIQVFCFIGDVSYSVWKGVVDSKHKKDIILDFKCQDEFQNVHKQLPPEVLTKTSYQNIDDENVGKIIPITFGNQLRNKLIPITGKAERLVLAKTSTGEDIYVVAATQHVVINDLIYLRLRTEYMDFKEDEISQNNAYYLRVVKGTPQTIRILNNLATSLPNRANATTRIQIPDRLDGITDMGAFTNDQGYPSFQGTIQDGIWLFEIIKMDVNYVSSHSAISEYTLNKNNDYDLVYWDGDEKEYNPINELLEDTDTTTSNNLLHPNVTVINNKINLEGDFNRIVPIVPENIEYIYSLPDASTNNIYNNIDNLTDRDRTTYAEWNTTGDTAIAAVSHVFYVKFPTSKVIDGLDKIYFGFDFDYSEAASVSIHTYNFTWDLLIRGPYKRYVYDSDTNSSMEAPITYTYPNVINANYLPNEYYKNGGDDNGESSLYYEYDSTNDTSTASKLLLNTDVISSYEDIFANPWIMLKLNMFWTVANNPIVKFKQLGFFATKNLNTTQEDFYIKMKGETV